jgi:large subunit ribosomal protein L3
MMADNVEKVDLSQFCGIKAGMMRLFPAGGPAIPVTVIKLIPNYISQVKTKDKDGVDSYQLAYYEKRERLVTKPVLGKLKKAGIDKFLVRFFEVRNDEVDVSKLGKEVSYGDFKENSFVDVTGITKGKGFQGVIKRYKFSGGPAAHGSRFHRAPGSIGNRATPALVFKGKKLPGRMGGVRQTAQNLLIQEVNVEKGYLLVRGSVPGSKNSFVFVRKAVKK